MVGIEVKQTGPVNIGLLIDKLAKANEAGQVKSLFAGAEFLAGELRAKVQELHVTGAGALARSFRAQLLSSGKGKVQAIAGSELVYAGIRDRGGTIFPHKKYLAIPLSFAGLPRGIWPRDMGKLKFIPRKGKNPLLVGVTSEGTGKGKKKIRPLFVLVKKVTQRGSNYLDLVASESMGELESLMVAMHADFSAEVAH